jgi:hypothetical protein
MLNDLDIVVDGLLPHRLICMLHRAKLVAVGLARLVLKGIGIDRIKYQSQLTCQCLDMGWIPRYIPRYVQRYGSTAAVEGVQQAYVFQFLL